MKYQNILPDTTLKNAWKAVAILITGLLLTVAATMYTERHLEDISKNEFALVCNDITMKITTRLHAHAQLLRSSSSLFAASDTVTRQEWKRFIAISQLKRNLPGILGVGFSCIIQKDQLTRHIRRIRNEGFPYYSVKPAGDRDLYTSIIYLEPFLDRNLRAFGYDMYADPVRRKAMERARDFDVAALSGKVILVQETELDRQQGTLMYVPVYRNGMPVNTVKERRAAIVGWVYCPYRMYDLMNGILGRWDMINNSRIHFQVYDNDTISAGSLLFDSQRYDTINHTDLSNLTLTIPIEFNEKKWTLLFSQSKEQISFFQSKASLVLFGGVLISLLLFALSLSLFSTSYRAQRLAMKLTSELKESEEKHRLLIENSHDIIYTISTDGVFMFVSPAWTALLGHPADQVSGRSFRQFVHPGDYPACLAFLKNIIETGQRQDGVEYRVQHINGTWHWHSTSAVPLRDEAGTVTGFEGTSRDVTERKQAEQQINLQYEALQKANAEKDKFFSIIAHDLRSPFLSLLGFSRLMVEDLPTLTLDELQKIALNMRNSANKLFQLLENLLEWSQMQRGILGFYPEPFTLLEGVTSILELARETAERKAMRISVDIPADLMVMADLQMFDSLMRNLVFNAIKFTPKGGDIAISAHPLPGGSVEISVRDTGIGISRNIIGDLFRLDAQTNRKGTEGEPSTGLGLILCKDYIDKHGGKLYVESEEGKGSTFYITLPGADKFNNT